MLDVRFAATSSNLTSNIQPLTPLYGDERIRTADLLLARQALSHLSYAPLFSHQSSVSSHLSFSVDCPLLTAHCSWAYLDLNQGPHAYQACALTN